MTPEPEPSSAAYQLVTVNGPTQIQLDLRPPGPVMIGRRADYTLELRDPTISREHAIFSFEPDLPEYPTGPGQWYLADTDSRHGTMLNGEKLEAGKPAEVRLHDFINVGPWTFQIKPIEEPRGAGRLSVQTLDDQHAPHSMVAPLDSRQADRLERQKLALLLECAEAIHAAQDEIALAEAVLDAAVDGTGFVNAAVLKTLTSEGQIDVLAYRGAILGEGTTGTRLSGSLIREAAKGVPMILNSRDDLSVPAHSIMELGIEQALCVPIMLGQAVAGFLYLDIRTQSQGAGRIHVEEAGGFALGLTRLAAMALANLMRLDIQKRHAAIAAEIRAAAETQQYLLPEREGRFGPFRYVGESRAGRQMGGDFFDVFLLDNRRLVVTLGDVTGKGVVASVLMTASLGFLHAALHDHGDPGRAVSDLNRYIEPRCAYNRFLTLWVGILDLQSRSLSYVDGGHGYAFLVHPNASLETLDASKGALVGGMPDVEYIPATTALPDDARLLVVSDGIIEQPPGGVDTETGEQFEINRLEQCLRDTPPEADAIAAIFRAVEDYAGSSNLADDATAVMVEW